MGVSPGNNESVFNNISEIYHISRPAYPDSLVEDLIGSCALTQESRILEIGVGTGKLTEAFAKRGMKITGIELGDKMAVTAQEALSSFKNVEIIVGDFNSYDFASASFDAVIAATSFHWLDPDKRIQKIHKILDKNGVVAIVDTRHVDAGVDNFLSASQRCYREYESNTPDDYRLPTPEEADKEGFRLKGEFLGKFTTSFQKSYFSNIIYSSRDYLNLLQTYSDVIAMEESRRNGLLNCIGGMIENEFGGKITKSYLWQLFVAGKS